MAKFSPTKLAEKQLIKQLRRVSRVVAGIVDTYSDGAVINNEAALIKALADYSEALTPWANRVVSQILGAVEKNNARSWASATSKMSRELRGFIESRVGAVATKLQSDQVVLIKSLPIEAGVRAQNLAREAALGGKRADDVAREIEATEQVTSSRAALIARTEIAKANASFTQARAESAGITHYIWRTATDGDVRESHAELEGEIFAFANPPNIEGEGAHHPGEFPNCRCFAEPIIPEV